MEFLYYLLKVSGCLIVFYLLYFLLFRNETFSKLNRLYLISTVLVALLIPLIPTLFTFQETDEWVKNTDLQGVIFIMNDLEIVPPVIDESNDAYSWLTLPTVLLFAYGIGVFCFLIKFMLNISKIIWQIKQNEVIKKQGYYLVKSQQIAICSFGKYVFWNDNLEFTATEKHQILQHELIHVKEKHTIDILFLELVSIFLWFNPFIYLYKIAVKNIHEYIADSFVFHELNYKSSYARLLIKEAVLNNNSPTMAHNFFNSITKNRLIMLSKVTRPFRKLKLLMVLPILCFLSLAFSIQSTINNEKSISETIINPTSKVVTEAVLPTQDTTRPDAKMSERDVTSYKEDETTKAIDKEQVNVPIINEEPKPKAKFKEISADNPMKGADPGQFFYAYDSDDKIAVNDDGSPRTKEEIKDRLIEYFKKEQNRTIKREDIILISKDDMKEAVGTSPRKSIEGEIETANHWSVDWSGIQNGKLNDMTKAENQRFKMINTQSKQTLKITSYSIVVNLGDEKSTNMVKYDFEPATNGNMFPEDILEAIKKIESTGSVKIFDVRFEAEGDRYVTRNSFVYKID
ncbi:MAG: M56 family metallopeptidase [Saprospiraceae bacterium]